MSLYSEPIPIVRPGLKPRARAEACLCLFGTEELCGPCVRTRFANLRMEIDKLVSVVTDHTGELWDEVMTMRARIAELEAELVHQRALSGDLQNEIFRLQLEFNRQHIKL